MVTILAADWSSRGGSSYGWVYLHQGGRYDVTCGFYLFRMRDYSPALGRWMETDPVGFEGGNANLYGYVQDAPIDSIDPSGLAPKPILSYTDSYNQGNGVQTSPAGIKGGAFWWVIDWAVANAGEGGIIVQDLTVSWDVRYCEGPSKGKNCDPFPEWMGNKVPGTAHSWTVRWLEAWTVTKDAGKPVRPPNGVAWENPTSKNSHNMTSILIS